MKNKFLLLYVLLPLLLLLATESHFAQTVIKEKINLNPKAVSYNQQNSTAFNDTMHVVIQADVETTFSVENSCGDIYSVPWAADLNHSLNIPLPSTGEYIVHVQLKITEGQMRNFGIVVDYGSFFHYDEGAYVIGSAGGTTNHDFNFSLHYLNDFSIEALGGFGGLCGEIRSFVRVSSLEEVPDCGKNIPLNFEPNPHINFSIQSITQDLVFYDIHADTVIGRNVSIPLSSGSVVYLRLLNSFRGVSETAKVTANINGVIGTIDFPIYAYEAFDPSMFVDNNYVDIPYNQIYNNSVVLDYDICHEQTPLDSVTSSLQIL